MHGLGIVKTSVNLLQADEQGGTVICDMYSSGVLLPTAPIFLTLKAPQSNTVQYPGLFLLDMASGDNTVTNSSASIACTTVTISISISWTSIPHTSLTSDFILSFWRKEEVSEGQK